ncbi:MAG: hypothetical protein K6C08_15765 [Oscillospiraceae bacterium]|nr:hypothetical protein [Oscillospiraceae bacterium]
MIITIDDDFDLALIAESGQCFRWEKTESAAWRILSGSSCLYLKKLDEESFDFSCDEAEFETVWLDYFDLRENYAAIRGRIDPLQDPFLRTAADLEKGIRILRQDPWEMLITFIISQNRNIPAIRRSVELLAERCGEKKTDSRGRPFHAFPEAWQLVSLGEQELKDCRLGYRWKYVHAAAAAVQAGEVRLEELRDADEERTIGELTKIFGVGLKVANCVSLFGLHHLDAFPQDVWIRRVLSEQYPGGYPFEVYSPYNGIYQQYMFACYRNRKERSKECEGKE